MLLGTPNPHHLQDAFPARARQRHPPATGARALGYCLGSPKVRRGTKRNTSKDKARKDKHKQRERAVRLVDLFLLDPISRKGASAQRAEASVPHTSYLSRVRDTSPGDIACAFHKNQAKKKAPAFVHSEQGFQAGWIFPARDVLALS